MERRNILRLALVSVVVGVGISAKTDHQEVLIPNNPETLRYPISRQINSNCDNEQNIQVDGKITQAIEFMADSDSEFFN